MRIYSYNVSMKFLKMLIPNWLLKIIRPLYHGSLAKLASIYYGHPSGKLFVIGVTGTVGKSTTAAMLSHILNYAGQKAGYMTTVNFFDGEQDYINKHGLSMPGGPRLQKQLKQILNKGCKYAIVECTSEGLAQNRHLGINFSGALFTNLSEAHIQAHGSFENYKQAKGKLFSAVENQKNSFIGVNLDNDYVEYFLSFPAAEKFGVSFKNNLSSQALTSYRGKITNDGFEISNENFVINLPGEFNKYNALLAAGCANTLGVSFKESAQALKTFTSIRGRMEPVENNLGLKIYVDYGCEPASFRAALIAAKQIPHGKLIHVFGSTGGHRDASKRFYFGKTSAELSDEIIITNDDVYDSDPQEIASNIESGIKDSFGDKRVVKHYEIVLDRSLAIRRALQRAVAGDLVLITGKGSEQFLVLPKNKRIEWDDVGAVKQELQNIK